MKISVIITCYNFERYVGEAIESVLAQRPGDYELELLVIDDASTDASVAVIERYPQARLLRSPQNQGVLLATLQAMHAATGEVITFLDADDRWLPEKLRLVAKKFAADPALTLLTHNYRYIDERGDILARADETQARLCRADASLHDELLREGLLAIDGTVWLGSAYALRMNRAVLDGFDAFCRHLPEPRATYQDFPLAYWWLTETGARFGYLTEVLFEYRLHSTNHSGAAASAVKMLRNVRKGLNTRRALTDIVTRRQPWLKSLPALRLREAEYEYLEAVYRRHPLEASRHFLQLSRGFWSRATAAREFTRLAAATTLGPDRATRWLTAVRRFF